MKKKSVELLKVKRSWYKRWWAVILYVLVGVLLIFGGMIISQMIQMYGQMKTGTYVPSNFLEENPPYEMKKLVDDFSPVQGGEQAPIVLVEFGDFNCSACSKSFPVIKQLINKYPEKIKFYWRNYPVINESSAELAIAGVCADWQGKFWQFHDYLFAKQGNLQPAGMEQVLQAVGINSDEFYDCLENPLSKAQVKKDFLLAEDLKLRGTPTFFINGYKIEGPADMETWDRAVSQLMLIY